MRTALLPLLLLAGVSLAAALPVISLPDGSSLEGSSTPSGVLTFLGVPYAMPPVGEDRWKPPKPWVSAVANERLNATSYGQACTQKKHGALYGGEDCLFLNVFVHSKHFPVAADTSLPVALWIHGGTYISGDGSQYNAEELVDFYNGHVIIVTINYRLNIFGFLGGEALRSLDAAGGSTGTLGLQDQRAAMKWVQNNIASFGGDANNVTLFGQSAGAGSISTHLTMQKSRGLFSAVVLQSGGFCPWIVQNKTYSEKVYNDVLLEASCGNLTCLQALSTSELYRVSQNIDPANELYPTAFVPTVDFAEVHTHPWVSLSEGNVTNVPILIGTNADEGVSYLPDIVPTAMTEFQFFYMLIILFDFGDYRDEIEALYLTGVTYPVQYDSAGQQYSKYWWATQRFIGDYFFTCPAQYSLEELVSSDNTACSGASSSSKDTYCSDMYVYHNQYALANRGPFVQHGFELPLVFHFAEHLTTAADTAMADKVATYWGNFFITRDPSSVASDVSFDFNETLMKWNQYSPTLANTTTFANSVGVGSSSHLKSAECSLLNTILGESMLRDYPRTETAAPSHEDSNDNSDSVMDDFKNFGMYILIAGVCVSLCVLYVVYQRKYGLTHAQAQQYLAQRSQQEPPTSDLL